MRPNSRSARHRSCGRIRLPFSLCPASSRQTALELQSHLVHERRISASQLPCWSGAPLPGHFSTRDVNFPVGKQHTTAKEDTVWLQL